MPRNMEPVQQEWIKLYVDKLLEVCGTFPETSPMREAILLRADHAMDLVKAWRERLNGE